MRILVTAIGSFSSKTVLTALQQQDDYYIVGCDCYSPEWHSVSKLCNKTYKIPLCSNEGVYIDALLSICKENNIQYIIPLIDVEVDVLSRNRVLFLDNDVVICISNEESICIMRDKYQLYSCFQNNNFINVIPTFQNKINEIETVTLPCIVKPLDGRSSEGCRIINTIDDLKAVYGKEKMIAQEYKKGNIYTVDYVRNEFVGSDFMISREELLRTKNGAGLTVRLLNNDELKETVSFIGKKLNIHGCVNIEFIYSDEKFYLMDINPRFSAGIAFSSIAGYDFVLSHLNCFLGKDIFPAIAYKEAIIAKEYIEVIL